MKVEHEVKLCIKDGLFSVVIVCLLNANYSSGTNSNGQYNMLCITLYVYGDNYIVTRPGLILIPSYI